MWPSTKCALVADTQELYSNAVKDLLERRLGFTDVIAVTSFEAATWNLSRDPSISLALLDLTLPDMDGLPSMASLRVAYPDLRLAVIAGASRREQILRALSVGVHGYLPRTLSINEMVQALSRIANGQIYVPPTLSDVMDDTEPNGAGPVQKPEEADRRDVALTLRQQEVMQLISEGKTNKEIARSLGLAEGTVKAHVNALFRALSVHNRASVAGMLAQQQENDEE